MMKEALRDSGSGDWQQIALLFFVIFFAAVIVYVFRAGSAERLEPYKQLPLEDEGVS